MNQVNLKFSTWLRLLGLAALAFVLVVTTLAGLGQVPGESIVLAEQSGPVATAELDPLAGPLGAPGTPVVTLSMVTGGGGVSPGDTVTSSIEFHHIGGTSPITAQLRNLVPSGLRVRPGDIIVEEVVSGANPLTVQHEHSAPGQALIDWLGSLEANAMLRITYPAVVRDCYDPNPMTIQNRVLVQGQGGGSLADSASIQVNCLTSIDQNNISLNFGFKGSDEELQALLPGTKGFYTIELSNSDSNPTVLGLFGIFPSRNFNIGMPPALRRVASLGWKVEEGETLRSSSTETQTVSFLVPLAAGQTRTFTLPVRLIGNVFPESVFEAELGYCITYDGQTCPGADPQSTVPPLSFQWQTPVSFTVRYRDLGDAPDSTNHAASPMLAYPAMAANFPTVFDPATGLPQGPAHNRPRPLHLGRRVSAEAEADIGPDMDPNNNIIPAVNIANRDRADDGLAVNQLNFSQCQTAPVPFRVLVKPAAVNYFQQQGGTAYLNIWLDGNQDGDWEDNFSCPGGQTAVEHIVIDFPVDVVALGVGLHNLSALSGLIPWPGGQAAWLRATLSEQPANKTLNAGAINYGDGRGYTTPFTLGETEDYLLRPPGAAGAGPDMVVELDANWRQDIADDGTRNPEISLNYTKIEFKIDYRNEGSQTAQNPEMSFNFPNLPAGSQLKVSSQPKIPQSKLIGMLEGGKLDLGKVGPGAGGTIILSWQGCLTCIRTLENAPIQPGDVFSASVNIANSDDVNSANDNAQASTEVWEWARAGFIHQGGDPQHAVQRGTTCSNDITLYGRAAPNATLRIFTDGFESGDVSADSQGRWSYDLSHTDGRHLVEIYRVINQNKSPQAETVHLYSRVFHTVDSDLPYEPISLIYTDQHGRVVHPASTDGNASQDASGWLAQLRPGETYQVSLALCNNEVLGIAMNFLALQNNVILTDDDGDGIYQGLVVMPDPGRAPAVKLAVKLSFVISNVETIYTGAIEPTPAGVAYDSQSGQPQDGVDVTALGGG